MTSIEWKLKMQRTGTNVSKHFVRHASDYARQQTRATDEEIFERQSTESVKIYVENKDE